MRDKDHKRTPVQSWNGKKYKTGKKCISMLGSSWKSTTPKKELKIWDHEADERNTFARHDDPKRRAVEQRFLSTDIREVVNGKNIKI